MSRESDAYKKIHSNMNIDEIDNFNVFRLGKGYSDNMVKGFPMVFITTPLLNLTKKNIDRNSFFQYMSQNNNGVFKQLNYNNFGNNIESYTSSPFVKLLTNKFVNIDLKDTISEAKPINETFYGYKQNLPSTNIISTTADELSVTFQETKDGAILKMFKTWGDYIEGINRGIYIPSQLTKKNKMIDYTCSIYYFLLDFDGETIQYYSKYTGCAPLSIPYSSFQQGIGDSHDSVQLPISFSYGFKEDMNPAILSDFNQVSTMSPDLITFKNASKHVMYGEDMGSRPSGLSESLYDNMYEEMDLTKLTTPGIFLSNYEDNINKKRYKLKFIK